MCGIAGGVFWDGRIAPHEAERAVRTMVDALTHRGPDGQGVFTSTTTHPVPGSFAVLGHTRLAILDVSPAGAQPMGGGDPQRPTITYNGEAYNFLELRESLERAGHRFRSRTDTEVLLRGYDEWGLDLVGRLAGMFAFALWDPTKQRLVVARDHVGIKPFYFFKSDGFLLFASEVRALLATGLVPRTLNATALWQLLGYQSVPAPLTLIDGVRMLEPGHWMTVDTRGEITTREYWNMLATAADPIDVSAGEARDTIARLLREAVSSHMVSDVPVGAFLSGGIDSSAVVALMAESGHTARTFSVGFDEQQFDESAHAALIANRFHTEHTHIPLGGDALLEQLPAALAAMDQPTGDAVNTYIVSGAVRARGITVAQSGLGGDEVFGGYPSFARLSRMTDLTRRWGKSPGLLRSFAASAVRSIGGMSVQATKAAALLESDGSIAATFPVGRQLLSEDQRRDLIAPAVLARIDRTDPYSRLLSDAFDAAGTAGVIAQISFAEARTYMHDVLLRDTDQMSMAHSLEVRVPLLDHTLIEYVMSLPDTLRQPSETPKRLLVEALGTLLPESIWNRPKQGFALPFDPWMRGPLRSFCEAHLGERGLAGTGIFAPAAIRDMWTDFLDRRKTVSWSRLWTLVVLGDWLERHGLAA